jgi:dATP pyrophosphohydrolase
VGLAERGGSVLVVIHTAALQVLLIERADKPGYWQSVTGSLDAEDEPLEGTARREVLEETGIDVAKAGGVLSDWQQANVYEIYPRWRHRYAPGVTHNTEHVFGLCVPAGTPVRLSPREHTGAPLAALARGGRCAAFHPAMPRPS